MALRCLLRIELEQRPGRDGHRMDKGSQDERDSGLDPGPQEPVPGAASAGLSRLTRLPALGVIVSAFAPGMSVKRSPARADPGVRVVPPASCPDCLRPMVR